MGDSVPPDVRVPLNAGSNVFRIEWVEQERSQDLAEPGLGFQFVAETGQRRPNGALRDLIRVQARRKRLRESRKSLGKCVNRPLLPSTEWDGTRDPPTISDLPDHVMLRDATCGVINRGPMGDWFNPFDTLPIENGGYSQYLITRYNAIYYPEDNPYSPGQSFTKDDVFRFAMSDEAVLHVFLGHVAMGLCNTAGADWSLVTTYHLFQAISLVNKRIAKSNHEAVTNATIFAVGCLAHSEVTTGSISSLKMHLDGLEALVKSRGGIQALGGDPLVLKFTHWVDNVCSIAMGTKPRFGLINPASNLGPIDMEPCTLLDLRYKAKLFNLTGSQALAEETIEVYRILRYLMAQKDKTWRPNQMRITKAEFESFADQLMHRLISIIQYKDPESANQNALIYGLFGNAALAHVATFICNPTRRGSVLELFSMRIRGLLEIINLRSFQLAYPEMMLWIIMVGGLASTATDNQGWFATLLAESCLAAGVSKMTELALFLRDFLWSDYYLDPICREFWDEVSVAQAVATGDETDKGG